MNPTRARFALAFALLTPLAGWSQVALTITLAPPPLPEYAQPIIPGDGYIWAPGYWSWNSAQADYYWVPGTWVLAPEIGELWTPGYWGYENSGYLWHGGYWGSQVGYYGGINYGHGYTGSGYQGGRWTQGGFQYNRAASNVNERVVHAMYNARVVNPVGASHASFQGGASGSHVQPTEAQRQLPSAGRHGPTAEQMTHEHGSLAAPAQRASVSHGAPPVAATPRPSEFDAAGVQGARTRSAARGQAAGAPPVARATGPAPEAQRAAQAMRPDEQRHAQQLAQPAPPHGPSMPQQQLTERAPQRSARPEPQRQAQAPRPQEQRPAQQAARQAPQHAEPMQRTERAPTREEAGRSER